MTGDPSSLHKVASRVLFAAALALVSSVASPPKAEGAEPEFIIVSGGPALREWENLRIEDRRHDKWWGNFIRPARVRIDQLRQQHGPNVRITWLVHKPSYVARAKEDGRPLISYIESVRDKYPCRLMWFQTGDQVINYLNRGHDRNRVKVVNFEFFGHSNKYCFLFDYSSEISGASKSWLHVNDLKKINRKAFAKDAFCKSWGCHTGESMTRSWRKHLGVRLVGAVGKTDYRWIGDGTLPVLSPGGKWVD